MAYVVTSPCVCQKIAACVSVCPCDCFYEAGDMLVIRPDSCIDCSLCMGECPVHAIFPDGDVPAHDASYVAKNRDFFQGRSEAELEGLRSAAR